MKIAIQAPWSVNDHLRNTIEEKIEKFTTYSNQIIKADVFLKMKEHSGTEDKAVEIRLSIPGPYIFAEGHSDTYEKAVAQAAAKIKTQLIKRKEKLAEH